MEGEEKKGREKDKIKKKKKKSFLPRYGLNFRGPSVCIGQLLHAHCCRNHRTAETSRANRQRVPSQELRYVPDSPLQTLRAWFISLLHLNNHWPYLRTLSEVSFDMSLSMVRPDIEMVCTE